MDALADLIKMQNKAILDQRAKMIKDMQKQLSSIYPQPDAVKTDLDMLLERLDKVEKDLAELKILQHKA